MKSIAFVLVVLAAGCAPVASAPAADAGMDVVTLSAERVAADRVRLILQNGYDGPVGYSLCPSALQRRNDTNWQDVPTDEVCTMEWRTLPAGQDATFEKRLPDNLPAGEYRYVTAVEIPLGTERVNMATAPFAVR